MPSIIAIQPFDTTTEEWPCTAHPIKDKADIRPECARLMREDPTILVCVIMFDDKFYAAQNIKGELVVKQLDKLDECVQIVLFAMEGESAIETLPSLPEPTKGKLIQLPLEFK